MRAKKGLDQTLEQTFEHNTVHIKKRDTCS